MNYEVVTIAEHSFVPSLLSPMAKVLDAGCRGFEFARALRQLRCKVWCIDADDLEFDESGGESYMKMALSDFQGFGFLKKSEDKQATKFIKQIVAEIPEICGCTTLANLSKSFNVDFWDLIKLDIEGSEYEVIMSLEKSPARQLSIEFHLHTGIYGQNEMTMMEDKLKALGYEAIQHDYTSQHGAGFNYWNSLFILR
jgi:FkbM family methyltransferase